MKVKTFILGCLIGMFVALLIYAPISQTQTERQYDPWADMNDDGFIGIDDIAYAAQLFGTTGDPTKNVNVTNWPTIQNVNVTNWPEDRPTEVKRGIQKIVVMDSFSEGVIIEYTTVLSSEFYFLFEPEGQLINVTHLYINAIFRTTRVNVYDFCFRINWEPYYAYVENSYNARQWTYDYTNPEIIAGINYLEIYRTSDTPEGDLYLHRLELFIEYYYYG